LQALTHVAARCGAAVGLFAGQRQVACGGQHGPGTPAAAARTLTR
jgi:hypothetical protein